MKKFLKRVFGVLLFLFVLLNIVTAFHAYKFTHFYDINALVKKPELMTGWEKTKAIMFGVDYPKKKITVVPPTAYDTFSVNTDDGLTLRGWKICDKRAEGEPKGAVILFHGHAGNKSGVLNEAEAFANMNYCVFMVDFRAHGESDGNTCTIGVNESKDVKATYEYAHKFFNNDIVLYGISLGAATITKAMADYSTIKPKKVILEMPFGTLTEAVKGRLRTMHLPEQPLSAMLTFWGGTEQGFWGFSHNPEEYVKKITCPTLVQWGVNDARVTSKEIDEIYANLAAPDKTLIKYQNAGHESLCIKEHDKWLASVSNFLKK